MKNIIPPIMDPMGKYWEQPPVESILLDDTHALMGRQTFDKLATYSATFPTGVYPGKLWKRHDGLHDRRCKPEDRRWLLVWFGIHENPNYCSNNFREILIVD